MRCAVYGCKSSNQGSCATVGIHYHTFPKTDQVRKQWIALCGRAEKFPPNSSTICSLHFNDQDYVSKPFLEKYGVVDKRQRLKPGVLPSKCLPYQPDIHRNIKQTVARDERANNRQSAVADVPEKVYATEFVDIKSIEDPLTIRTCLVKPIEKATVRKEQLEHMNKELKHVKCLFCGADSPMSYETDPAFTELQQKHSVANEELAELRTRLGKLAGENADLQAKIEKLESIVRKNDKIVKSVSSFLTVGQMKRMEHPGKLLHWTADDIANGIAIHASGGVRAYRMMLKRNYPLPSLPTIRRWCTKVPIVPGFIEPVIKIMQMSDYTPLQRLCVLSFDEMKVKTQDKGPDETLKPTSHVVVVMLQGIFANWKQPIYFQFNCTITQAILQEIVAKVERTGFLMCAVVCDLDGSSHSCLEEMQIDINKSWFPNPVDATRNVYFFADMPHLMKMIRNHFVDHGFVVDGKEIDKCIIENLLAVNNEKLDSSIAYKISEKHLTVKFSERQIISYATELFSRTIAEEIARGSTMGEIKSPNAVQCSEFFKLVNDWFDCFKCREKTHGFGLPVHMDTIDNMSKAMNEMRVKGHISMMPFQKEIILSNNSLKMLFNDLQKSHNINYLLTNSLNKAELQNFFGEVRHHAGRDDHPDQHQFAYRMRSYILGRNVGCLSTSDSTLFDDTTADDDTGVDTMVDDSLDMDTLRSPGAKRARTQVS